MSEPALVAPPRQVPGGLVVAALVGRWSWAGAASLMLFTGLATPAFVEPPNLAWALAGRAQSEPTTAEITAVREGAGAMRFRPVTAVEFTYVAEGRRYSGTSYARGAAPEVGAKVPARVWTKHPGLAVITGLDAGRLAPTAALLPLGLGVLTLGVWAWALGQGLRAVRLLRGGVLVGARLVEKQPTGREVNGFPVMRLVFEAGGARFEQSTLEPERFPVGHSLPALHPPGRPQQAALLGGLCPGAQVGADGQWAGGLGGGARLSALWTAVCGVVALAGLAALALG